MLRGNGFRNGTTKANCMVDICKRHLNTLPHHGAVQIMIDHVNSTRPQIQFLMGEDLNTSLGFLKCTNNLHRLWVQDIRTLETNLYRAIPTFKFPS